MTTTWRPRARTPSRPRDGSVPACAAVGGLELLGEMYAACDTRSVQLVFDPIVLTVVGSTVLRGLWWPPDTRGDRTQILCS